MAKIKNKAVHHLYELLSELPHNVHLCVGEMGCDGNIVLEAIDEDGDILDGVCPLIEITPTGELVEQGLADDDRSALDIIRDAASDSLLTKQVNFRLKESELEELQISARAAGMTVSQFVRGRIC